eukprot:2973192-Rhodomonas_salina.2
MLILSGWRLLRRPVNASPTASTTTSTSPAAPRSRVYAECHTEDGYSVLDRHEADRIVCRAAAISGAWMLCSKSSTTTSSVRTGTAAAPLLAPGIPSLSIARMQSDPRALPACNCQHRGSLQLSKSSCCRVIPKTVGTN